MKAALLKTLDGPEALCIGDVAEPVAGPGEVIVRVAAVGLNFADTLMTRGKYQHKPALPFSPGAEFAGTIETIGTDVRPFVKGDRVAAYVTFGAAREKLAVVAASLIKIPESVPDAIAAGAIVTYGTALHGLKDRGRLVAGETVVVTGAAGGAGLAAVEIAKLLGARVIAVVSSDEKAKVARDAGADATIVSSTSDLKNDVRAATGGNGADVVYDCVGGASAEPLIRALAWQGRFLVVGFASGEIPKIPLNLLLLKGAEATGVFWGDAVSRDAEGHRKNIRQIFNWISEGRLKPKTHGLYPLERIAEALAVIEGRKAEGKVILTF